MRRRLTDVEWQSVCEHADGRRAAGAAWHDIEDEAAEAGVCEADITEMQGRHRQWARREQKLAAAGLELPAELAACGGGAPIAFSSAHEETRKAVLYICGDGLLAAKPSWRRVVNRTLRRGDEVQIMKGPGPSWLVCAVCIQHADGTREILAEHRVRQRLPSGFARTRGETLRMEVLELEDTLATRTLIRRAAAIIYAYWGEGSGIRNASHLARVSGVSRQAVHAGQVKLRTGHKEREGKATGVATGLAGQVPGRARKSKVQNPKSRE